MKAHCRASLSEATWSPSCLRGALSCTQGKAQDHQGAPLFRSQSRPVALNQLDLMSLELPLSVACPPEALGPKCYGHSAILCQPLGSPNLPVELLL